LVVTVLRDSGEFPLLSHEGRVSEVLERSGTVDAEAARDRNI